MRYLLLGLLMSAGVAFAVIDAHAFTPVSLVEHQYRDGVLAPDGSAVYGTQQVGGIGPCDQGDCVYNHGVVDDCPAPTAGLDGPVWDPDEFATALGPVCIMADWDGDAHGFHIGLHSKGSGTTCVDVVFTPPKWTGRFCHTQPNGQVWQGDVACILGPKYDKDNNYTVNPFISVTASTQGRDGFAIPTRMDLTPSPGAGQSEVYDYWSVEWTGDNDPGWCRGNCTGNGIYAVKICWEPDAAATASFVDSDGDSDVFPGRYSNSVETFIGTQVTKSCPVDTVLNNEQDSWPVDFNDNRLVNGSDWISFNPHMNTFAGQQGYDARWDLNTNGVINGSDLLHLNPYMNTSCQ